MMMVIGSDSLKILKFTYPSRYGVDSVKDGAGNSLKYLKEKDRPVLMVELPIYFHKGDTAIVTVEYRTNLFYHMMNYGVVQENLVQWYPHCGYRHLSQFDVRYSIDKGYGFLSVGDRVSDSVVNDKHVMEYQTPQPVTYLSFNYGIFDTLKVPDGVASITIYSLSRAHGGKIFGGGSAERVAVDIAGSMKFYSENFAKYPYGRLEVDDMTVTFGQGSPGLVHLSGRTFDKSYHGVDDLFRAHEVAHQWWGHLVVPETYHEAWLSEGMAEYSAMMYIQLVKNEEKEFRELIKEWKKTIVSRGMTVFGLSDGYRAGPIVLGTRLRNELSPADYNIIVYYKAAYMLHMLRFELEGTGQGRGKFLQLMKAFAEANSGKLTSTEDFIESARRFLGDRTDQFFDQWLYGWKVPRIEKKFKNEDDGSVSIKIDVSDMDNGLETSYPVKLYLSNDSSMTAIYRIRLGENQFQFQPEKGLSVKGVEFNPDNDILEH